MMRPQPARWFEILAASDDVPRVLAALAATREVELEPRSPQASAEPFAALVPLLTAFDELAIRYHAYWPPAKDCSITVPTSPLEVLEQGVTNLRGWAERAEPLVKRVQEIERERAELLLWQDVLEAMGDGPIDFEQLGRPGTIVHKRLVVFPAHAAAELPPGLVARHVEHDGVMCLLVVGTEQALRDLATYCAGLHGRMHPAPAWLKATAAASLEYVPPRLHALEREQAALEAAMDALNEQRDLGRVLGDIGRLQWLAENVKVLETTDLFCWITGWTTDLNGRVLARALDRSGVRALLHFPPVPRGREPPLLLRNPWWARPFELFSRALGMPAAHEADPSVLLALAVPLMFGYMFGDVGQGLVIALVGLLLRNRIAIARLLVAGGLSAAAFGFVFGSAFGIHVMPPLWVHPIDAPLTVLVVPLFGGAVLLIVGLLLDAIEAYWRGALGEWLASDSGLLVAYVGTILWPVHPILLIGLPVGLALYSIGTGVVRRSVAAGLAAIAGFVERMVQLLINTLSFARVGAFALAHAGLSSAIVSLMDASEGWILKGFVLVLGNVVVLVLETMVVAIQTTRLVLFEFFTRFLVGTGRAFRPLSPPPGMSAP